MKSAIMEDNRNTNLNRAEDNLNKDQQGVDKAPGEESGRAEQVKTEDLKGKKVDADPEKSFEKPIQQLP